MLYVTARAIELTQQTFDIKKNATNFLYIHKF